MYHKNKNFSKKLAYNKYILYNIYKDCGRSLRTMPRRGRYCSTSLFLKNLKKYEKTESFFIILKKLDYNSKI